MTQKTTHKASVEDRLQRWQDEIRRLESQWNKSDADEQRRLFARISKLHEQIADELDHRAAGKSTTV